MTSTNIVECNVVEWELPAGAPNYRYFKLLFTAALRLGAAFAIRELLNVQFTGTSTVDPPYKKRQNYHGCISINGKSYDDVVFVVDHARKPPELVTFWKKGQGVDKPGSKGGAHPFAELYMGYLCGKTIERKTFDTGAVAAISAQYNADKNFNVVAWIVNSIPPDMLEPPRSDVPLDGPIDEKMPAEHPPELRLLNKWTSDVRNSGTPYTNYEVDACIKDVIWGKDERISLNMHWEDGKYIHVKDFGRFDLYATSKERQRVLHFLEGYDGKAARARMILTLKGDSSDWTLASATMLKRIPTIP
jgi:hypothetical protein